MTRTSSRTEGLERYLPPPDGESRATAEMVAETLRNAISHGVLPAGMPLRQDHIAAHFAISHIPVREALQQLISDGLVEFIRNKGAVVSQLSAKVAHELTEFRFILEGQLIRWSTPRITAAHVRDAEVILAELDDANEIDKVLDLSKSFHYKLYEPAERPFFMAEIDKVRANLRRYLRLAYNTSGYKKDSQDEHWKLLKFVRNGDAEEAADLVQKHIQATGGLICKYLLENVPSK
nr:GntR family transcriptional regulator [Azospirillum sp. B510]